MLWRLCSKLLVCCDDVHNLALYIAVSLVLCHPLAILPARARDHPVELSTIAQKEKNRLLQYGSCMQFDGRVSAHGVIGDSQARKLDMKRVYTHVKTILNANLVGIPERSPTLLLNNRYCEITCTVKLAKYAWPCKCWDFILTLGSQHTHSLKLQSLSSISWCPQSHQSNPIAILAISHY